MYNPPSRIYVMAHVIDRGVELAYLPLRFGAADNGDLALLLRVVGCFGLLLLVKRRDLHGCLAESDDVADVRTLRADYSAHSIVRDVQVSGLLCNKASFVTTVLFHIITLMNK